MTLATAGAGLLRGAWNGFLDVVFPPQCVSCRAWGAVLCPGCEALMEPAAGLRCKLCWRQGASLCSSCFESPPAFAAARSAFVFDGAARDAVLALKYRGVTPAAGPMAAAMTVVLREWQVPANVIVPVPMSGSQRRIRGYNQAELLARSISRAVGPPVEIGAIRRISGPRQVGQPSRAARRENAASAYVAGDRVVQGTVLLVDDVMTTGATLAACSRVLKARGAERVYALTFARE